jgi:integrase/recombinase XerD
MPVVEIIRKAELPHPAEVPASVRDHAAEARRTPLREPRPIGFPLLFSADLQLIEPAVAFLHEHFVQRAHTAETLRTYAEILCDWFDTLEQNGILWNDADASDLVAYRNRMLLQPSEHTGRAYRVTTINHRVRGVLRFYEWAVRSGWLRGSLLVAKGRDCALARGIRAPHATEARDVDRTLFVLRQYESLPRPLTAMQARELLAALDPPYDLMARWQLYTGLRVSELLPLTVKHVEHPSASSRSRVIDVIRKGRKAGYVIASAMLIEETEIYLGSHRRAALARASRNDRTGISSALFLNSRALAVKKSSYQRWITRAGARCGFKATTHLLRATFACMMLARLQHLANQGAAINPLLVVKVLMGHEHIQTTDRYLRAITLDTCDLDKVLDSLLADVHA